ncbi:MAG TPA: hypothetical protein VI259_13860 [Gemmatimonadaceae bacterium]
MAVAEPGNPAAGVPLVDRFLTPVVARLLASPIGKRLVDAVPGGRARRVQPPF